MSDDEDDWFEQALDEDDDSDAFDDDDDAFDDDSDAFDDDDDAFDDSDADSGPDDAGSDSLFGDEDASAGGDAFGADADSESPFEEEGGAFGGDDGAGFGDDETDALGEDEGNSEPFDAGGGNEGLFDEDFGSAFDAGGGDEFDDEDFESEIPRIDIGIEGLDDMIQGGVPERHLMVVVGSAGTGKTTFGLQFLYYGLQQGDNSVFITLEQSHESIIDTANEWGWDFDQYEAEDSLAVVDLDPVEMANSLDNIRGELPELIEDFDADRLVLDSVSLLEMMYNDPAKRRTEVFDFTRSLKEAGVTTFLTSEASESNPYASRHGIIEYLTDAVFILQYVRGETRETRLAVEIQKIRNANHSREMKPYEITSDGLSVYQQANIF